jgi:heme-degrading monooxygenase HmoA
MTEWGAARRLFLFRGSVIETLRSQREAENPMITEIAQIDVKPGTEKDFEAAVAKARPLFLRAKGGKGFELHKSVEKPSRYRLLASWETLENHTVDFRGSADFAEWRALVGQYFASPPEVEHTVTVLTSAG